MENHHTWLKSFNLNCLVQFNSSKERGDSVQIVYFFFIDLYLAALGLRSCICRSGGSSLLPCMPSPCGVFSCGAEALGVRTSVVAEYGSVVVAPGLGCSAACGIFPTRGQTHAASIGRWILNH